MLRTAFAFIVVACGTLASAPTCRADDAHQIPFIDQLKLMTAVASERQGDYESVSVYHDIGPSSAVLTVSAEAADDNGRVREGTVSRHLRREDLRNARILRRYIHSTDPPEWPGTTHDFSAVLINEIRATGHTSLTFLDVVPEFGSTTIARTMTGSLTRVGSGPVELAMLVNGRPATLRVLHITGRLADDGDGANFDYLVLDDPDNPLVLRQKVPDYTAQVTRIDFPLPAASDQSLEQSLARDRHALVYGIYFKFNQADIRPVSEPVLKEIAGILRSNADWKLTIVGHTDNVGGDAANLDLSRRRAAEVKAALVNRYGIAAERLTTSGFGASQPQAKNDTPEGRARNRRVELTRS